MSEHLSEYRASDGSSVFAGRIQARQASRFIVSSAPIGKQASEANGYHRVAVDVPLSLLSTPLGSWLVISTREPMRALPVEEFAEQYEFVREPARLVVAQHRIPDRAA